MQYITDLKGMNGIEFFFDEESLNEKLILCKQRLKDSEDYDLNADTVLLDSYHSATIEGARTTIESVKKSLNAPKSKSDKMVVNNMRALDTVYSGFCIDDSNIRELWNMIVDGVCENTGVIGTKYRDGEVYISSLEKVVHTPAPHAEIDSYMSSLFEFMNHAELDDIYKSILSHFYFVYIHPFCDGNGWTGRLLVNLELMKAGYPPIDIKFIDRIAYYNAFDEYHGKHNLDAMEKLCKFRLI